MKITVDDVLKSPVVAYPAARARLLPDERRRRLRDPRRRGDRLRMCKEPAAVYSAAGSHTLRVADRRDMDIPLLPNETEETYKNLGQGVPRRRAVPRASPGSSRRAWRRTTRTACRAIKDPSKDLDVVELHDAFTISDMQTYEDIGIRPYGRGRGYVESGDCYHTNPKTGKPGKLPANLSGGLIGCMHAVGATGIMQVVECMLHLHNRHAEIHGDPQRWESFGKKKPADWQDLQVKGAKRGAGDQPRGRRQPRDLHHPDEAGRAAGQVGGDEP